MGTVWRRVEPPRFRILFWNASDETVLKGIWFPYAEGILDAVILTSLELYSLGLHFHSVELDL